MHDDDEEEAGLVGEEGEEPEGEEGEEEGDLMEELYDEYGRPDNEDEDSLEDGLYR